MTNLQHGVWRPMLAALTLTLLAAGCGGDADETTETTAAEASADQESSDEPEPAATDDEGETTEEAEETEEAAEEAMTIDASEVVPGPLSIVAIDFTTAEVTIRNNTDAEIDLDGHFMCNFPSYAVIDGVGAIGAGETLTITSTVAIPGDNGELGIYTAEDFGNAEAIVAYAEWGSGGHTRSEVAVEAKIWTGVPLESDGTTLTIDG